MKRGAIVGLVVGAVVVVAGAGAAWWLLARPPGPADVAEQFLRALADGDADAALARTDLGDVARDAAARAYADAAARLADPKIGELTESQSEASVAVSYSLQGRPLSATLGLRREGDRWLLTDAMASLTPTTTAGAAVRVGGLDAPAGTVLTLLPGAYRAIPLPAGVLTGSAEVVATPGATTTIAIEASLSLEASSIAQEQLDAYAHTCAQPATAVPPSCGLRVPWGADLSSLQGIDFRVEKTPQVTLAPDATSFAATGGVIVATARGASRAGGDGAFTYRADDWSLYGSVSFDGDQLVLAVR